VNFGDRYYTCEQIHANLGCEKIYLCYHSPVVNIYKKYYTLAAFRSCFRTRAKLARVIPWKGGKRDVRKYEVTIIVQSQLEEEARNELVARVSGWLLPDADEKNKPVENHWGLRHLAYPIRKHSEGYYVMYETELDADRIGEIERNLQYSEDILRYLVIRKEE
jgi:small subunit ribosomal protein S6